MAANGTDLFHSDFGWNSFRKATNEAFASNEGGWVVITDIHDFFPRIGNHPLENHLRDLGGDVRFIKLLRELLLFWAGDRRSFGIPVGSDASRIISEAALAAVDRRLHEQGYHFKRFVDDYFIFTDSKARALSALEHLSRLLNEEGLSFSSSKTVVRRVVLGGTNLREEHNEHQHLGPEEVEVINRTRISGRTSISKRYERPREKQLARLREVDIEETLRDIEYGIGNVQQKIRDCIKHALFIEFSPDIVRRVLLLRISSLVYFSDALVKEANYLNANQRNALLQVVLDEFPPTETPVPYLLFLSRVVCCDGYQRDDVARAIFQRVRISSDVLAFRHTILFTYANLTRHEVRELATVDFSRSPPLVQRAIAYAVANYPGMSDEERRPLLRNILIGSTDYFVRRLASTKEGPAVEPAM